MSAPSRRQVLTGASALVPATALTALPAAAETPLERIERLSRELAAALTDAAPGASRVFYCLHREGDGFSLQADRFDARWWENARLKGGGMFIEDSAAIVPRTSKMI